MSSSNSSSSNNSDSNISSSKSSSSNNLIDQSISLDNPGSYEDLHKKTKGNWKSL